MISFYRAGRGHGPLDPLDPLLLITNKRYQWPIEDFSYGGANSRAVGITLLFGKICAENYMKMKEIGLKEGGTIITSNLQVCQWIFQR